MRGSELNRLDQEICGAIWTSPHAGRLMEKLGYDIGPRPPGSQAMGRGLDCVGEALEQLKARRVHTESVPVPVRSPLALPSFKTSRKRSRY